MCFGVPMEVQSSDGLTAICVAHGRIENVNMALFGQVEAGTQILVHRGSAFQILSEIAADEISAAIAASKGEAFDHLIDDIFSTEPVLPSHLRPDNEIV